MSHCGWNRRAWFCRQGARHNYLRARVKIHRWQRFKFTRLPLRLPTVKDEARGCCIVGGGHAGAMLALLLARRRVRVTLLEMHHDFDREFRGDTVHPSTLEILDQIGLAERVHSLRAGKVFAPIIQAANGTFAPFDLRRLKTKFPYILMIPQSKFLELLTTEAAQ